MSVGIIVVSHSFQLANGVVELARQMTGGAVRLVSAGGTSDDGVGTSVERIMDALQTVDNPAGALVLMDLGSAILSAEMALEMLAGTLQGPVLLSSAPLVEGCIAASLEAAQGLDLPTVKQAAEKTASIEQLQLFKPISASETEITEETPQISSEAPHTQTTSPLFSSQFTLRNSAGLHARPAALLVQAISPLQAQVRIQTRQREANVRSIVELLSLGARQGDTISVSASGSDAQTAITTIAKLIEARFYEDTETPANRQTLQTAKDIRMPKNAETAPATEYSPTTLSSPTQSHLSWQALPIFKGIALAPAFLYTTQSIDLQTVPQRPIHPADVPAEQARLQQALNDVSQETIVQAHQGDQTHFAILEAQALMLSDPALFDAAAQLIAERHITAISALALTGEQFANTLTQIDDALIAARAIDIRDAIARVIHHLGYHIVDRPDLTHIQQPVILLARTLTPFDIAMLPLSMIAGICTVQGGTTDHTAILARSAGIPTMTGVDEAVFQVVRSGDALALDAEHGLLYHLPSPAQHDRLQARAQALQAQQAEALKQMDQHTSPIIFQGRRISLFANISTAIEAEAARHWGAEGIGLLRTELLFAADAVWPTREEERHRYTQVFRAFYGTESTSQPAKPLVVRTLDAGADKPLPALARLWETSKEANPALGLRGLRLQLAHPELLEQQLQALLLAAADTGAHLHLLFPMVSTVEEFRQAHEIFISILNTMRQQQLILPAYIPVGIMIEVPAAALMAEELAREVDFFSIGANDLAQYTMAADRTSASVASLTHALQPALWRLIRYIAKMARQAGKPVAVCGEIASDPRLAPLLIGSGVDELSMTPTALPAVRTILASPLPTDLPILVEKLSLLPTRAELEQVYTAWLDSHWPQNSVG